MRTHLSIYKVILCVVTLSHHPNNCSEMYHYVNERIGRSPRHSLKDAKETRHKNVPLGNCLQPLSFSSFLLQLICFVIELWFFGGKCRYNFWFHQIFFKKSLEKRNNRNFSLHTILTMEIPQKLLLYLCKQNTIF